MARARRSEGPRRAVRWIGEVLVVDGSLSDPGGARGVWRGGRSPVCARVHVANMVDDIEYDDDVPAHIAASLVAGDGIVQRFATYRSEGSLVIVEDDAGDLSLRDVIDALHAGGGTVPTGLALHIAAEIVRALRTVGAQELAIVDLHPARVVVGWDGRVTFRAAPVHDNQGELDWEDPLGDAAYGVHVDVAREHRRVLGAVLYEILVGKSPWAAGDSEDDDLDREDVAEALVTRRDGNEHPALDSVVEVAPELLELVEALLDGEWPYTDALSARVGALHRADPFDAGVLAGMLRGLFPEKRAAGDVEREDRLSATPGPRVEPETWALLDTDAREEDAWVEDLDDVRRGRGEPSSLIAYDGTRPYEPSVDPVDPFDDE